MNTAIPTYYIQKISMIVRVPDRLPVKQTPSNEDAILFTPPKSGIVCDFRWNCLETVPGTRHCCVIN